MAGLAVLLPFLFIALILGLVIFLVIYNNQKEKERTRQLQQSAGQLGWSFLADAAPYTSNRRIWLFLTFPYVLRDSCTRFSRPLAIRISTLDSDRSFRAGTF